MSFIQQFYFITGKTPLNRRRALIGLSLLALTACSRSPHSSKSEDGKVAYYTCTMHPFVRSQEADGTCPVCGMNLVPVLKAVATTATTKSVYIDPKRLQEIGARSEVVAKGTTSGAVSISAGAVLPTGKIFIVFVDHGSGQVEPREVLLGSAVGESYPVLSGLAEGERVFVTANFLIDAECRIQGVLKTWGETP